MNKEFIPYEQALALKELGFDEEGLGTYSVSGQVLPLKPYTTESKAILFSQAFRWFREKYNLIGSVCEDVDGNFSLWTNKGNLLLQGKEYKEFKTYEEAELACLIKLIEIVKQQNYDRKHN
jgi:hypothetical protein